MFILQVIAFTAFALCALSLLLGMTLNSKLFKRLAKGHPQFYESIGRPKAFGYTEYFPTSDDYVQRIKGALFAYGMVFKGIPTNFPHDAGLRSLARTIRYVFMTVIVSFVCVIVAGYLAFR